VKRALIQP